MPSFELPLGKPIFTGEGLFVIESFEAEMKIVTDVDIVAPQKETNFLRQVMKLFQVEVDKSGPNIIGFPKTTTGKIHQAIWIELPTTLALPGNYMLILELFDFVVEGKCFSKWNLKIFAK